MLFQNKKQKPPLERLAVFLCIKITFNNLDTLLLHKKNF